jgi:PAS domain S-box-containing protein
VAAARSETGAGRQAVEDRLADTAAELMAARTDAERARRGFEGLQAEVATLREYAAQAKAEAEAAREAANQARRSGATDDRAVAQLRTEIAAAVAKLAEYQGGFDEARQAAVAARRDAEQARAAAEKAGAVNEATGEQFTQVWQRMLTAAPSAPAVPAIQRPGSGGTTPARGAVSQPKAPPAARDAREGFDDDPRALAVLDLKGKFRELNPAFCKLVGYQEHQFGKATWPSVLDRKAYAEQKAQLDAMAAGEADAAPVDSTFMHGQGLMVLIKGEVELVRDAAGLPHHLLMVAEQGGMT